jgi:hypothetical protein
MRPIPMWKALAGPPLGSGHGLLSAVLAAKAHGLQMPPMSVVGTGDTCLR